jgi:peptide/nickel transport system substrate-binding protein
MMVSPSACRKNGEEWCASHPVGTGPFEFVSWDKGVRTVYKKFTGYWQKGKPYLDGVEWIPVADSLTRFLSFKKGELDFVEMLSPKDLASLERDGYPVIKAKMGSGVYNLIPDSANPRSPFADVRVRQATQYAIDTQALAQVVLYGQVEPANQYIFKGHWGYNTSVTGYPYNPAKARKLLTDAGYPSGFKTKLLYRTNPQDDLIYTAVQGYLKAVGIDVELDPAQTGRYNQVFSQAGKWEGLIVGGWNTNPDVAAALAMRYAGGGKYFSQMLVPDDYAKAVRDAITAKTFAAKQKAVKDAMKLIVDKHCLQIQLYCPSGFATYQASLHDHGFYATPNTASWTPEDAWLAK